MEQSSTSPATNNAIRGAEQSGNIAKQCFARKGVKGWRFMAIWDGLINR